MLHFFCFVLQVWAEYFEKAKVDGLDITDENFRFDLFPLKGVCDTKYTLPTYIYT